MNRNWSKFWISVLINLCSSGVVLGIIYLGVIAFCHAFVLPIPRFVVLLVGGMCLYTCFCLAWKQSKPAT